MVQSGFNHLNNRNFMHWWCQLLVYYEINDFGDTIKEVNQMITTKFYKEAKAMCNQSDTRGYT